LDDGFRYKGRDISVPAMNIPHDRRTDKGVCPARRKEYRIEPRVQLAVRDGHAHLIIEIADLTKSANQCHRSRIARPIGDKTFVRRDRYAVQAGNAFPN